ncbi:MAG: PKD domain-containing protein [Bacteroidales bacterium]|nr:PKD domain-containing protein [Bacteroidales bacterium]
MKKTLLTLIAAIAIGSVAMAQFNTFTVENAIPDLSAKSSRTFTRQWVNIGTPFVATDVYGNTVRLQDYLDSGKFVVIDYSCTWCGPCWNLHTSGMLEQIDALQDFQVIWVECESSNTTQQIFGPRGGSGYASQTQGDWTHNANGDSITYPIIDDDANRSCLRTCAQLYTGSVPTLMLITPYGQYINLSGYFSYQQVSQSISNIRSIANSAPRPGSAPQCKIDGGSTSTITGYPASLKALVNTVDPVSISWTFDGGTPATDTGYNVTTRFGSNGTHRVILTVTNATGTDHDTINITSRSLPANAISYSFGSSYVTGIGGSTAAQRYWAVSFPP